MPHVFVWRLEDIGAVIFFALVCLFFVVWALAWSITNWRKWALCWWGGCGGIVDGDATGIHLKCQRCGKITR